MYELFTHSSQSVFPRPSTYGYQAGISCPVIISHPWCASSRVRNGKIHKTSHCHIPFSAWGQNEEKMDEMSKIEFLISKRLEECKEGREDGRKSSFFCFFHGWINP